jgi:rfaE bifunctional protein nucleotidyltransferase chain/domain
MSTKITWVNGCFDVLHIGHIKLFQKAWELGNPVVVGIDGDDRIRQSKGDDRPVNSLHDRIGFLKSIKYIKEVIPFHSDEELNALVKRFQPEYFVIGEEYRDKVIIGKEWAKEMVYLPRYGDVSSSDIINGTHKT